MFGMKYITVGIKMGILTSGEGGSMVIFSWFFVWIMGNALVEVKRKKLPKALHVGLRKSLGSK